MRWEQRRALEGHEDHVAKLSDGVELRVTKYPGEKYEAQLYLGEQRFPLGGNHGTAYAAKMRAVLKAHSWVNSLVVGIDELGRSMEPEEAL